MLTLELQEKYIQRPKDVKVIIIIIIIVIMIIIIVIIVVPICLRLGNTGLMSSKG